MAAATYNFQIEQGSDFEINFQYNNEDGSPVDLSTKCIVLRWVELGASPLTFASSTVASLDNSSGYSLTANNLGKINFQISSKKTKDYSFNTVVYDLDVLETIGLLTKNIRILTGTIGLITRNFSLVESCAAISADPSIPLINDIPDQVTPTPAASSDMSPTPSPTPLGPQENDLCLPDDCATLDIYSVVYPGSGIQIYDNQNNSGQLQVSNTGIIENIELAINGLRHNSPQDLTFILTPPSGSGILLASNTKIPSYNTGYGFSFMFSNRASAGSYLHNISNGGLCNIFDKTNIVEFNNQNLLFSFDHLLTTSITGVWTLNTNDNDIGVSGSLDSWKLILTYQAPVESGD